MLAFLGWNPGTEQELFTLEQLIADFSLERVNKAGAKFDPDKTKWFQQQYFQQLDTTALTQEFSALLGKKGVETSLSLEGIVSLIKERAVFVADLWEQGCFFFERPEAYDQKAAKKAFKEDTPSVLLSVCEILEQQSTFDGETISRESQGLAKRKRNGVWESDDAPETCLGWGHAGS